MIQTNKHTMSDTNLKRVTLAAMLIGSIAWAIFWYYLIF